MVPSAPLPPAPSFPVPPYPLSQLTRNQLIPFARAVLKHIGPRGLDIGYGNCKAWSERFPVTALSERTRSLLGPEVETVAMADFRSSLVISKQTLQMSILILMSICFLHFLLL